MNINWLHINRAVVYVVWFLQSRVLKMILLFLTAIFVDIHLFLCIHQFLLFVYILNIICFMKVFISNINIWNCPLIYQIWILNIRRITIIIININMFILLDFLRFKIINIFKNFNFFIRVIWVPTLSISFLMLSFTFPNTLRKNPQPSWQPRLLFLHYFGQLGPSKWRSDIAQTLLIFKFCRFFSPNLQEGISSLNLLLRWFQILVEQLINIKT